MGKRIEIKIKLPKHLHLSPFSFHTSYLLINDEVHALKKKTFLKIKKGFS